MLENFLIDCCSPTLASLKAASLFNCRHANEAPAVEECVSDWNSRFSDMGVHMSILRMTDHSALIYVYRASSLAKCLSDPEIQRFLESYGYDICLLCDGCSGDSNAAIMPCYHGDTSPVTVHPGRDSSYGRESFNCSIEHCLNHLRSRIEECGGGFPHEIGVFLDYPLCDVQGFIENEGRNCKMVGAWKVYGDEMQARKRFARFTKCTSVYSDLWRSGKRSILQLTVAG